MGGNPTLEAPKTLWISMVSGNQKKTKKVLSRCGDPSANESPREPGRVDAGLPSLFRNMAPEAARKRDLGRNILPTCIWIWYLHKKCRTCLPYVIEGKPSWLCRIMGTTYCYMYCKKTMPLHRHMKKYKYTLNCVSSILQIVYKQLFIIYGGHLGLSYLLVLTTPNVSARLKQ